MKKQNKEEEKLTIERIDELEKAHCDKNEYSKIFKCKDKIQEDFVNKFITGQVSMEELLRFTVALM